MLKIDFNYVPKCQYKTTHKCDLNKAKMYTKFKFWLLSLYDHGARTAISWDTIMPNLKIIVSNFK